MKKVSTNLSFFISLSRIQTVISRKLDAKLGGLGFSDFLILYVLSQEPEERMRRIDLAHAIGLTASGVTRLLLPMEKIGLVSREVHDGDARVSFVRIEKGGKRKLEEAIERAELYFDELFPSDKKGEVEKLEKLVNKIGKRLG